MRIYEAFFNKKYVVVILIVKKTLSKKGYNLNFLENQLLKM